MQICKWTCRSKCCTSYVSRILCIVEEKAFTKEHKKILVVSHIFFSTQQKTKLNQHFHTCNTYTAGRAPIFFQKVPCLLQVHLSALSRALVHHSMTLVEQILTVFLRGLKGHLALGKDHILYLGNTLVHSICHTMHTKMEKYP